MTNALELARVLEPRGLLAHPRVVRGHAFPPIRCTSWLLSSSTTSGAVTRIRRRRRRRSSYHPCSASAPGRLRPAARRGWHAADYLSPRSGASAGRSSPGTGRRAEPPPRPPVSVPAPQRHLAHRQLIGWCSPIPMSRNVGPEAPEWRKLYVVPCANLRSPELGPDPGVARSAAHRARRRSRRCRPGGTSATALGAPERRRRIARVRMSRGPDGGGRGRSAPPSNAHEAPPVFGNSTLVSSVVLTIGILTNVCRLDGL